MGSWLSTTWDPTAGIPNLDGKVAVVTGANSGIGYAVTAELARHGAKVYLACRNEQRAQAAIEKLHTENPKLQKGNLVWLPLNLEDLNNVATAAQALTQKEQRLDILVNNAGLATHSFQTTPAGFEMAMGVNHLAHFLFTVKLLPLLKSTAAKQDSDVRIVTVSSVAHRMMIPSNIRFDKIDDFKYGGVTSPPAYSGMRNLFSRYGVSKLANILFTKELQRRLDEEGVSVISTTCNPGGTNTGGGLSVWPAWLRPIMGRMFAPATKGALPILYLACAPEIGSDGTKYKARYYNSSCTAEAPSTLAQDMLVAKNLWKTSEEAVAAYLK